MFGREKVEELKLAQEPKPEPLLTEAEVASVKKCHAEQLERERIVTARCKAHYIVYGGVIKRGGRFAWCSYPKPGISDSLKLTKSQKEALKTHIASWLNESDWFKP